MSDGRTGPDADFSTTDPARLLQQLGEQIGVARNDSEILDDFASRLHCRIDQLIRDEARTKCAGKIIVLMAMHDLVALAMEDKDDDR